MNSHDQVQFDQAGTHLPNATIGQALSPLPTIGYVEEPGMILTANSSRHRGIKSVICHADNPIQSPYVIQGYNSIESSGLTGDCNSLLRYDSVEFTPILRKPARLDRRFSAQLNSLDHNAAEANLATEATNDFWDRPTTPYYAPRTIHWPPGVLGVENIHCLPGKDPDQSTHFYDIVPYTNDV